MLSVDPTRLDLAAQFKANPVGPHSPELQRLLKLLRNRPATDRYVAAQIQLDGPWFLARTTGLKPAPVEIFNGIEFATEVEANWAVFRKRWAWHTGDWLQLDDDDCADPTTLGLVLSSDLVSRPLLGYANEVSVEQGGRIEFKVSALQAGHYHASLVRLRSGDHTHVGHKSTRINSDVNGAYPARRQHIIAGSFIDVPPNPLFDCDSLTMRAWIWPTRPATHWQTIAGAWNADTGCGYALVLDERGALSLVIGDGEIRQTIRTEVPLLERHWYDVIATIDSSNQRVVVAQRPHRQYGYADTTAARREPLKVKAVVAANFRLAASSRPRAAKTADGRIAWTDNFNGKIEAPALWSMALQSQDIDAFLAGQPDAPMGALSDDHLIASWDFSLDISGTRVTDTGKHQLHGMTVNLPARAMKGVHWDGSHYRWTDRPEHYAAIHFHDDDLYDCAWQTDFSLLVPTDLPSGVYCIHLQQDEAEDWIPFVVRPPLGSATAKLALLLPTASYWAYANRSGVITYPGREHVKGAFANISATDLYLHHHPQLGLSMYDDHSDGSGVCYSSRLRPILSMRPGEALWQLPADTHIIDWLDEKEIDYDVITEDELNEHGYQLLQPYRCVITGTHPEYPSLTILDAIANFQDNGGRFIYFGGNGFYWRVSWHPSLPGVIEMRRAEDGIRAWMAEGGEYYHASTAELGGMWRRMGRAPQSVAGTGMTAQGFDLSTYYSRTAQSNDPRAQFIFKGIDSDERIGDFGIIGGGAAGWEIDRADPALGTPPHALTVATATTFSANYHWMKEELHHTHDAITGETSPLVRCDMVFYETPKGGAVFATSSIAWAGALSHNEYDNNVSRITWNVINRFLDDVPFQKATEG